jgi:hypothetical protein
VRAPPSSRPIAKDRRSATADRARGGSKEGRRFFFLRDDVDGPFESLVERFRARYPFLKINHAQEFGCGRTRKGVKSKYSRLDHPKYVVVPAESLAPMYKKRLEQYQQVFGFR